MGTCFIHTHDREVTASRFKCIDGGPRVCINVNDSPASGDTLFIETEQAAWAVVHAGQTFLAAMAKREAVPA